MDIHDLRGLYRYGVQELHDAAARRAIMLPGILSSIASANFRRLVEQHANQAARHRLRLEALLAVHGVLNHKIADKSVIALLEKAETISAQMGDEDLRDAVLLSALRCVVHHGIVACTVVSGHARTLSLEIDRRTLIAVLEEDRVAEHDLAALEEEVNQIALMVSLPAYL